jgi:single-strand DNA-binding protein
MINSITIYGNVGRDAEVRGTPSGKEVASFRLAASQGGDRPTIWLDASAWSSNRFAFEDVSKLTKGDKVIVQGRLKMREWTDKNGNPRQDWGVEIDRLAMGGGRKDATQPQQQRRPTYTRPPDDPSDPYAGDDSIPF